MARKATAEQKAMAKRVAEEATGVVEAQEARERQAAEAREAAGEKITMALLKNDTKVPNLLLRSLKTTYSSATE